MALSPKLLAQIELEFGLGHRQSQKPLQDILRLSWDNPSLLSFCDGCMKRADSFDHRHIISYLRKKISRTKVIAITAGPSNKIINFH